MQCVKDLETQYILLKTQVHIRRNKVSCNQNWLEALLIKIQRIQYVYIYLTK